MCTQVMFPTKRITERRITERKKNKMITVFVLEQQSYNDVCGDTHSEMSVDDGC